MEEFFRHAWEMLLGRVNGPLRFRFILQPLAAAIIACRAGLRDARSGRPAYGWAILTNPVDRHDMLREGWRELARVFILAVVVDLIYEIIAFHRFYVGQSLIVAVFLALLPYPLIREFVNRVARRWQRTHRRALASDSNATIAAAGRWSEPRK